MTDKLKNDTPSAKPKHKRSWWRFSFWRWGMRLLVLVAAALASINVLRVGGEIGVGCGGDSHWHDLDRSAIFPDGTYQTGYWRTFFYNFPFSHSHSYTLVNHNLTLVETVSFYEQQGGVCETLVDETLVDFYVDFYGAIHVGDVACVASAQRVVSPAIALFTGEPVLGTPSASDKPILTRVIITPAQRGGVEFRYNYGTTTCPWVVRGYSPFSRPILSLSRIHPLVQVLTAGVGVIALIAIGGYQIYRGKKAARITGTHKNDTRSEKPKRGQTRSSGHSPSRWLSIASIMGGVFAFDFILTYPLFSIDPLIWKLAFGASGIVLSAYGFYYLLLGSAVYQTQRGWHVGLMTWVLGVVFALVGLGVYIVGVMPTSFAALTLLLVGGYFLYQAFRRR
jgi:hypothetical protein